MQCICEPPYILVWANLAVQMWDQLSSGGGWFTLYYPNVTSPAAPFAAINCVQVIIDFLHSD